MDFRQVIEARYSVRAYRPDPVPDALLTQVLDAARLAPTACNRQPFRLIVVQTRGREAELRRIYPRDWFVEPPLVVAAVGMPAEAWVRRDGVNYCSVDVTIAFDHLILAAASLGLGTCWIAAFDPKAAREVLALPPEVEPVAFTPLGYPADQPSTRHRQPLSELVRYERW
jgi:nitroreductase